MSLALPPPKRNQRRPREPLVSVIEVSSSSSSFQKSSAPEDQNLLHKITLKLSGIISLVKEKVTNILDSDEEKPHLTTTAPECLQVPSHLSLNSTNCNTLSTPSFGHNSGEIDQLPVIDAELKEHLAPQRIKESDNTVEPEAGKNLKNSKALETQNSLSIFDRSWTSFSENEVNSPKNASFQTSATSKKESENEGSLNSSQGSSKSSVKLMDVINFLSKVHENTEKEVCEFIPRSQKKSDPLLKKIIRRPRALRLDPKNQELGSQKSLLKSKKRGRTEFGAYMCESIQKKNKENLMKHVLKRSKLTANYDTRLITVGFQKVPENQKKIC